MNRSNSRSEESQFYQRHENYYQRELSKATLESQENAVKNLMEAQKCRIRKKKTGRPKLYQKSSEIVIKNRVDRFI